MPVSPSLPAAETGTLMAPAPAKVNLTLEVLGLREDGYHQIDTVLQTLELADQVTLLPAQSGISIQVTGPYATGTPADRSNLACRAVEKLSEILSRPAPGMTIRLEKNIPAAAGLGGGASDAATVLRLLQRHWPDVTEEALTATANAIGSDEAFFLTGGTAPRPVRVRLLGAFAVQVVVALVTSSIRVYTEVAFGILVPMLGLGLAGLWGARHGRFRPT